MILMPLQSGVADDLMDVLGSLHRRLVRQHALYDEDIALAAEKLADLLGLEGARLGLVRGDEGGFGAELVDVDRLAVDIDERHAGVGGGLGDRRGGRRVDRIDDDGVDAVGDEVLNLAQLFGDVVLGVLDLKRDARKRLGVVRHAVAKNGQEVVVKLVHRHANFGGGGEGGARQHAGCGKRKKYAFHDPVSSRWGARRSTICSLSAPRKRCGCLVLDPKLLPRTRLALGGLERVAREGLVSHGTH